MASFVIRQLKAAAHWGSGQEDEEKKVPGWGRERVNCHSCERREGERDHLWSGSLITSNQWPKIITYVRAVW